MSQARAFNRISARVAAAFLTVCLALAPLVALPREAHAYFNWGAVEVSLGAGGIEVAVGDRVDVSVSITPASAEQTLGCGMPKCPQSCSAECVDENGQCRCGGTESDTYRATAKASSKNPAIAVGVYRDGVLGIYGKAEGETDITVRASLRQYTDGEATVHVVVAGEGQQARAGSAAVELPQQADAEQLPEDRQGLVDRTVMGRTIRYVRIGSDECDAARLEELAGADADVTFWEGDTYYHPRYSLTFSAADCAPSVPVDLDPALGVSTQAEGTLYQLLDGLDSFVTVDFACKGALPARATVYALAEGSLADGDEVALFSYDAASRSLVREEAGAAVIGGYAVFEAAEGKTYVVSSRDLQSDANAVVSGAAAPDVESCCIDEGTPLAATSAPADAVPPLAYVLIGMAILAVVAAAVLIVRRFASGKAR